MTRRGGVVRAELAVGGVLALVPLLYLLAAPSSLTPMFDDRSIVGGPAGVVMSAIGAVGALIGWILMIRISRGLGEPDRPSWRRSALTRHRPSDFALTASAVISAAIGLVGVWGLLGLPLDAPHVRLRTIGATVLSAATIAASVTALVWIALTAWFGDDR
jgi:hypothetical protein